MKSDLFQNTHYGIGGYLNLPIARHMLHYVNFTGVISEYINIRNLVIARTSNRHSRDPPNRHKLPQRSRA